MAEMTDNEKSVVLTALRNELVLEKIFQFLPMKSLLSCSEVCKIWNTQARTYVRDHRKCTISICPPFACNQLNELDETVRKMAVVPFNSLDFYLEPHENCLCHEHLRHGSRLLPDGTSDRLLTWENLFAKIKLKHLLICLEEVPRCPAVFTIFRLLLEKGNEVKDLHLGRISLFLAEMFQEINKLDMQQLEKLWLPQLYDDDDWSKDFIGKILRGSNPKLTKIINNGDNRIFEILPESRLRLLSNFTFVRWRSNDRSMNQAMKLAASRPTLSAMDVDISPMYDHPLQCLQIVQSLLRSSFQSLGKLKLSPIFCLKATSYPPMENLVSLKIGSWTELDEIRSSLQSIEFGRLFPKLHEIELSSRDDDDLFGTRPLEFENEWLPDHNWDPQYSSNTTSFLALEGFIRSFSFLHLKKSFPAVVDLSMMPNAVDAHVVPYRLIFRLWPNLRAITVAGTAIFSLPNCDADFCGINQEEVVMLRSMDAEYLRDVYIVPIRPCVTTMLSLNRLAISLCYDSNLMGIEPGYKYLSSVTKFLVFQRMPWLTLQLDIQIDNNNNYA